MMDVYRGWDQLNGEARASLAAHCGVHESEIRGADPVLPYQSREEPSQDRHEDAETRARGSPGEREEAYQTNEIDC